jgi:DNA-directed RNA polymerase subunit M/transcription elongation factor TFIIS
MVITCPHCGKRLQAKEQAIGRILPCPSCKKDIDTSEAVEAAKRQELQPSLWHYMKEGWLKDEEVGPISEDEFVSLVRTGKVKTMTIVRSPQFTDNCWQNFKNVNFMAVEASYRKRREAERAAEQQRLARENIKQENLQRLRLLIRDVIADGRITQSEQQLLDQFAMTAQLSKTEVEHILRVEGKRLMDLIVAESLADGVFTPDEEARVQGVSAGLRIPMQFDDVTSDLIELSRLCWLFESCELDEFPTIESPVQLQAREMCFGRHKVEWNKVSQSSSARRSQSLSLDSIGVGDVLITSKRVLFMSDVQSKSVTHASIGRIDGYSDGILLVRTSGGSVFLLRD